MKPAAINTPRYWTVQITFSDGNQRSTAVKCAVAPTLSIAKERAVSVLRSAVRSNIISVTAREVTEIEAVC